ncbi:uncharacterized protein Z520_09662 [Fonsecaea multimorphosa CBS 102226]|uniref:Uncharacterized protein n=1 Tax=Fonsecaea multimorphosa CBS 102226 TaxID=1442371 RepID=A0A0D2IBT9_9EURO|nr:uncharacterized protein Z520_09662 [Fonsecaea multimorphosa CBS 102226]KIX94616.1 hypothetical protein Z520_09662 [Fonsecaea multimorphosa CBS 102226]OAL20324.1 hypothetical protein AYO22_09036 [Fonsecaea multimorphosa]
MSALDPQAPSQPSQQTGLNQTQNPASKTSQEQTTAQDTSSTQSKTVDRRSAHDVPSEHGEAAKPGALGSGERGPLTEKRIPESDAQNYSEDPNLEGQQMRMPGEGDVARAVRTGGGGGHGEEESLTQNIDKKAADHEAELHKRGERTGKEIEEEEQEDWTGKKADIASALGQGREGRDEASRPAVVLAAEE